MKKHAYYILCVITGILLVVGLRSASAAPASGTVPPNGDVMPTFSGLYIDGAGGGQIDGTMLQDGKVIDGVKIGNPLKLGAGVTIAGDTNAKGNLDIGGNIKNTNGDVIVNDSAQILGTLDIQGTIKNSTGDVYINDALKISKGPLDLYGIDIINTATQPALAGGGDQPVYIKDSLHIIGGNPSNLSVTGDISGGSIFSVGNTTVVGILQARDKIQNDIGTDVVIDDSLKVTGDINTASIQVSGKSAFLGDTEIKNAYITGSLQNNGDQNGGNIFLDDNIKITGKSTFNKNIDILSYNSVNNPGYLTLGSSIKNSSSAYDSASGYTGPVKIDDDAVISGKVTINGEHLRVNAKISDTTTGKPVRIDDDLEVTGNIKVTAGKKIGKYTIRSSGPHSVSGGGSLTKEKACNSVETVISCGYKGDSISTGDYDFGLELNNLLIGTSSCKVSVKNTIANKLDLYVYTMCFDPASN